MTEAIAYLCAFLGAMGFVISLVCVAMIAGFVRSTHTVQYLPYGGAPVDDQVAKENEELLNTPIGKKKREPSEVPPMDTALDEIATTDVRF